MEILLPWLMVVGLLSGAGGLCLSNHDKANELTRLRESNQQLEQERVELDQARARDREAESDELARLRKEHDDLLRLRNEVRPLREYRQELGRQVQGLRAQIEVLQQAAAQPAPALAPALTPTAPPGVAPGGCTEASATSQNLRTGQA